MIFVGLGWDGPQNFDQFGVGLILQVTGFTNQSELSDPMEGFPVELRTVNNLSGYSGKRSSRLQSCSMRNEDCFQIMHLIEGKKQPPSF